MSFYTALATAAGASDSFPSTAGVEPGGGFFNLNISGTFGGATATPEYLAEGATDWVQVDDLAFTDDGAALLVVSVGEKLRLTISGATSTTSIFATVSGV